MQLSRSMNTIMNNNFIMERYLLILNVHEESCLWDDLTGHITVHLRFVPRTHGSLSWCVFIRHWTSLRIGVKQKKWLEMSPDTFRSNVFPFGSNLGRGKVWSEHVTGSRLIKQISSRGPYLLYSSIIKKHPFGRFGVIGEGWVMFTRKTDHPHQM